MEPRRIFPTLLWKTIPLLERQAENNQQAGYIFKLWHQNMKKLSVVSFMDFTVAFFHCLSHKYGSLKPYHP